MRGILSGAQFLQEQHLQVTAHLCDAAVIICKTVGSVAADQSGDDESYGQPQIPVP